MLRQIAEGYETAAREVQPDNTPVEQILGGRPAVNSLRDLRELQYALDFQARLQGKETFEEANDFDVDDGYGEFPLSPAQLKNQAIQEALAAKLVNTAQPRKEPVTREQVESLMKEYLEAAEKRQAEPSTPKE